MFGKPFCTRGTYWRGRICGSGLVDSHPFDRNRCDQSALAFFGIRNGRETGQAFHRLDTHNASGDLTRLRPVAPRDFRQDFVPRSVNVRRLKTRAMHRNILGHELFRPGRSGQANENRQCKWNPFRAAPFGTRRQLRGARAVLKSDCDPISALRIRLHADHARRSFRLRARAGIKWKQHPDACRAIAGLAAMKQHSITRNIDGLGDFQAHTDRTMPTDPRRHLELRPGVLPRIKVCAGIGHGSILAALLAEVKHTSSRASCRASRFFALGEPSTLRKPLHRPSPDGSFGSVPSRGGPMENGVERRAARRFSMMLPLKVRFSAGNGISEKSGETRDVSFRGLYFLIEANLESGSSIEFVLTLPQKITLAGDVHIRCYARVLRVDTQNGRNGVAAQIERYEFLPALA